MNDFTPPIVEEKSPSVATRRNGKAAKSKAGVGLTYDSPEARSRQILLAMMAFRDGDFSVRLPARRIGRIRMDELLPLLTKPSLKRRAFLRRSRGLASRWARKGD